MVQVLSVLPHPSIQTPLNFTVSSSLAPYGIYHILYVHGANKATVTHMNKHRPKIRVNYFLYTVRALPYAFTQSVFKLNCVM